MGKKFTLLLMLIEGFDAIEINSKKGKSDECKKINYIRI